MGMVLIDAFLVRLELISNFHSENLVAFCLIFMVEIQQRFALDVSWCIKRCSHHAIDVRIRQ